MTWTQGKNATGWLVVVPVLIGTLACGGRPSSEKAAAVAVEVQTVGTTASTTRLTYSGTIEESAAVALSFPLPGTVERVLVSAGQRVRRGELLAVLNETSCRSSHELAQAKLEQAEDALKRFTPMHKNSSMPEIRMVEVETAARQARAAAVLAKKNLDDCRLRAPVGGVIGRRSIEPGMNALPDAPVLTLLQIDKVFVKAPVPENEIARIRKGQPAEVVIPALSMETLRGKVEEIGVQADPLARCYDIKIGLDNPDGTILPGMVCTVALPLPAPAAVVAPSRAVLGDESGERFVYVLDAGAGRVARRTVRVGAALAEGLCILSGLREGEQVVVAGTQKLADGCTVTVGGRAD